MDDVRSVTTLSKIFGTFYKQIRARDRAYYRRCTIWNPTNWNRLEKLTYMMDFDSFLFFFFFLSSYASTLFISFDKIDLFTFFRRSASSSSSNSSFGSFDKSIRFFNTFDGFVSFPSTLDVLSLIDCFEFLTGFVVFTIFCKQWIFYRFCAFTCAHLFVNLYFKSRLIANGKVLLFKTSSNY